MVKCVPALKTLLHRSHWDSFVWQVSQKHFTGQNDEWDFQDAVKHHRSSLVFVFFCLIGSKDWPFPSSLVISCYILLLFNVSEN